MPNPPRVYTNNEPLLDEITEALHFEDGAPGQAPRLVVISGPIGGGKTSLACQWHHEHREKFPDGAFFAPMAEFRGPDRASSPELGESEGSGAESECLLQFLREIGFAPAQIPQTLSGRSSLFHTWSTGKSVLVVVDGPARGSQVRPLQPGAGRSAVVIAGPLVPGDLRMDDPCLVDMAPLTQESATELVRRILPPDDPRPEQEPEQLDELIAMCRDHTIALCVAARLLADRPKRPVARLVEQLSREKRRLKVLSADSDRSVPVVFDAAVERLDARTQRVYTAFGKHPGHGDIGAEALAAALDEDPDEVQDRLDQLVNARLIQEGESERYSALGLVRDHARQMAEDDQLTVRFARWYVDRAISAGHALMLQRGWLERLWPELDLTSGVEDPEAWFETERANLRATAEFLAESQDARLLPLAVASWPFHERTKHVDDMDRFNELAADLAQRAGNLFAAGLALVQRGFAFRHRGEHDKGAELFAEAERIAVEHGPRDLEATAVESLGVIRREQGTPWLRRTCSAGTSPWPARSRTRAARRWRRCTSDRWRPRPKPWRCSTRRSRRSADCLHRTCTTSTRP